MQRLHTEDLTGMLQRSSEEWTLLKIPAIAEQNETVQIGDKKYHFRRAGDVLHPERDPPWFLESSDPGIRKRSQRSINRARSRRVAS